jgi:hypothetical protein
MDAVHENSNADAAPAEPAELASAPVAVAGAPQIVQTQQKNGVALFVLGACVLAADAIASQLGAGRQSIYLVPIGGLLLAGAAARRFARTRPDEPWLGQWLILGVVAKIAASLVHYYNLEVTYGGRGDASGYDDYGRRFAHAWLQGGPKPDLTSMSGTNFIRWFTGVVYYVFGSNALGGTFVYGLLAVVGSYLWYRATVDAVPFMNRRMYLALVLFAPSVLFWPALISKEALMQLGLGALAMGASLAFRQRLLLGALIGVPGGWLVWVVRPHLLALVAIAAGFAYFAGRVRKQGKNGGLLSRPIGLILMAFVVAFTIGQAANFLGVKSISLSSVQSELDQQSARSSIGGSHFQNGGNSLNPLSYPNDALIVLVRPFPWEAGGGLGALAGLEGLAIAGLLVWRFSSLRASLARSRDAPFLLMCWVLTGLYIVSFASFSNFGLLVRERSLVLPALFVLVAVDPVLARRRADDEPAGLPAS